MQRTTKHRLAPPKTRLESGALARPHGLHAWEGAERLDAGRVHGRIDDRLSDPEDLHLGRLQLHPAIRIHAIQDAVLDAMSQPDKEREHRAAQGDAEAGGDNIPRMSASVSQGEPPPTPPAHQGAPHGGFATPGVP